MSGRVKVTTDMRELFEGRVKHVCVMSNRECDTGFMAFGYPDSEYGFDVMFENFTLDQIPALADIAQARGFVLSNFRVSEVDRNTKSFMYSVPNATWWNDPKWPDWSNIP